MWPFEPRPTLDPAQGDAGATRLRSALAAGDWRTASESFTAVPHPDDRAFYYWQAGSVPGVQDWVPEWVSAQPRSAVPVIVAAHRYIDLAFQGQAPHLASSLRGEAALLFDQRLRVAEDLLRMAVDLDGDDPAPWASLVTTGYGLRIGITEARRRFGEAVIRHRWHRAAHHALLQQLCPRWGGSMAEVHEFARRTIAEMPDGCDLGALAPYAHMEHWIHLDTSQYTYLQQPEVLAQNHAAADRSVRHPAHERRPGWPQAANMFAWAFARAGDLPAAALQFDAIGDLVTEWPWGYPDDAVTRFIAVRRAVRRRVPVT